MKILLYIVSILMLVSCTKELDEGIFSVDTGVVDVGIDPDMEDPIDDDTEDPDDELDPDMEDPDDDMSSDMEGSGDDDEMNPDMEEEPIDPELSSDNELIGWEIVINGQNVTNVGQGGQSGNVIELRYPEGTDISNVDIILEIPETATVVGNTTGINFNTNDGIILITIVAENTETNTFAFGIEIEDE